VLLPAIGASWMSGSGMAPASRTIVRGATGSRTLSDGVAYSASQDRVAG
jgi:hypothetical protein